MAGSDVRLEVQVVPRLSQLTLLRLVVLAACCAASVACTKEEQSCVEDGSSGCPDGGLADDAGGVAPLPFRYALFVDFSEIGPEPVSYLAGTDICGVVADCDGVLHQGVRVVLDSGVRGHCVSDDACTAGVVRTMRELHWIRGLVADCRAKEATSSHSAPWAT